VLHVLVVSRLQAVRGEGLPRLRSPFEFGNLFVIITVEFPGSLTAAAMCELLKLLPPPLHAPSTVTGDDVENSGVDQCQLADIDPDESYQEYIPVHVDNEESSDGRECATGQPAQCAQQ
tara:strand:- start:57 stop:413 length:357 start_codon:yes stop_codon:yes gene_type:complete